MKKKDVIWLLVRLGGLYFSWQGLVTLISLYGSLAAVANAPGLMPGAGGLILQTVLLAALYISLGLYMLLSGHLFYHLLSSQPDSND